MDGRRRLDKVWLHFARCALILTLYLVQCRRTMEEHPECPRRTLLRVNEQHGRATHDLAHPHVSTSRLSTSSLLSLLRLTPRPSTLRERLRPELVALLRTATVSRESRHRDAAQPAQADRRGLPWTWDQRCVEEGGVVELKMTVQAVFDPVRTSPDGKRGKPPTIHSHLVK